MRLRELDDGPFRAAVLDAVTRIPKGRIATYEDLSRRVGYGESATELVAMVIETASDEALPLHRVTKPDGTLPQREGRTGHQATRLQQEGVVVADGGRVEVEKYRFDLRTHRGPIYSNR